MWRARVGKAAARPGRPAARPTFSILKPSSGTPSRAQGHTLLVTMAQPAHSYVQYFVPYDGDTEEHPNVFLVKRPQKDLRLADLQQVGSCPTAVTQRARGLWELTRMHVQPPSVQAFPLPGQYFFRVKTTFGKTHGE